MAQIPEAIPLDQVQGETTPIIAPAPTDFGLGHAAQEAETVARGQRRVSMLQIRAQAAQDRTAAMTSPAFQSFGEGDAKSFADDAAAWDPSKPGFATDQVGKVQSRLADAQSAYAASGATPGQLAEFRTLGLQQVAKRGAEANQYEQQKLMQQAGQVQETAVNGYKADIISNVAAAKQKLIDGYDGSSPTLVPQMTSAFDAAAGPVIAAAPPALQSRLQLEASVMKEGAIAEASELQGHAQTAYVVTQTEKQASTLINAVVSNPLAYDDVSKQLPAIAANLPAGEVRDKLLSEWQNQAAKGRVGALIDQQNYAQALGELNDKRYDGVLLPGEKDALEARAEAASREHGPQAVDKAVQAHLAVQGMDADAYARATTGKGTGFDYDAAANNLAMPADAVAEGKIKAMRADQAFAATGSVHDWSPAQLQAAAAAAPPAPADPDYTNKLFVWQAQRDAAAGELKARQDPGAWAFAGGKVPAKGAPGSAAGQDIGSHIQDNWQSFLTAPPSSRVQAGANYASLMLSVQARSDIAPGQMQIVPQAQAAQLVAAATGAPPEGKLAAYSNIAGILSGLPAEFRLPDGSATVSPRQMLIRQLQASKMSAMDISAIVDSNGDPAKIGAYVAALNDPTLKGAAAGKQVGQLSAAVRSALAPYLATATSPADEALNQGRLDRVNLEARELMVSQHLNPGQAAQRAAQDITAGYSYMNGWRMPAAQAATTVPGPAGFQMIAGFPTWTPAPIRGDQAANLGSHTLLAQLTGNGGAGLYTPSTIPGAPADRSRIFASQVMKSGAWKTLPDDSGLALMVPKDGSWTPVADKWGRPVQASWSTLQGVAGGQPSPFAAPPPNHPTAPNGQPIPAFSSGKGFAAAVWGVTGAESSFKTGAEGPVTRYGRALGIMQVIPQFAAPYAQKLFGLPLDVHRLQWDDNYNRQIGSAMLSDNIQHFGATGPGLALAIAAYNAGRGNVEGWRDAAGYHPGIIQSAGDPRQPGGPSLNDWIPRIAPHQADGVGLGQTRAYLQKVIPAAFKHLQEQ